MSIHRTAKSRWRLTTLLLLLTGDSLALPGTLSNTPLFLSNSVEPNVFLVMDDSGSMEWELVVAGATDGIPFFGSDATNYYVLPTANNGLDSWYRSTYGSSYNPYVIPHSYASSGGWKFFYYGWNALYYNPNVTYEPWPGNNTSGSALYSDASATAARTNPDSSSNTINLTSNLSFYNYVNNAWVTESNVYPAKYYRWTDSNSDSVMDNGEGTLVTITSTTASYTGSADRYDCAAAPTCTYAEEIQNFANWFVYYRKRGYALKAAAGNVVNATNNTRMALQRFNSSTTVQSVASMSNSTNKANLLTSLYGISLTCNFSSCPGTPGRTSLNTVGGIFEGGSSPILASGSGGNCQQNFDLFMSDGYWNDSFSTIANTDGDGNTTYDGGAYGDTFSSTLGDVAMNYYERDLKTSISNEVPDIEGIDEATHQHLVTYSVAFGVDGSLDPVGTKTPGVDSDTTPGATGFTWPDPTDASDGHRVDDMWHAAYNSRGKFASASNPTELSTALNDAMSDIADRTGSAAAVAFNSSTLGTDTDVFLALFNSNRWFGTLLSYPLDPNTGAVDSTENWDAGEVLDSRSLTTDPRTIWTSNGPWTTAGTEGVPFQWANLTTAQKNDLKTTPTGATTDTDAKAQARLNFIRGDRSNEGAGYNFRVRGSRLGDFVTSNPVYVSKPEVGWPDTAPFPTTSGSTYSDYVDAQTNRTPMIYIGSNDGMLHGFDAANGEESMAYLPYNLFSTSASSGLHYLTDPAYSHRYYVDLSPTVSDAYMATVSGGSQSWRTVLMGGYRAGGMGYFLLDVTDPSAYSSESNNGDEVVLWEFGASNDSSMGYSFARPTIVLMNDGRWAAIVGNGYNNTGSYAAKLFILYLEGGIDGRWTTTGTPDYRVLSTCSGTATSADCVGTTTERNGLSTPVVIDTDGDGDADRVYAGDVKGNMWVFDISNSNPNNWETAYKAGSTPKPLFTTPSNQPITTRPAVAKHITVEDSSSPSNAPNAMVFFGTGQYLATGDLTTTYNQAFYGVWDTGQKELTTSNLVQQTFQSGYPADIRVTTDNAVGYTATGGSKKYGWYINLTDSGERVVVNPVLRGEVVFFNTLVPSTDPCDYGGSGWLMSVKQENGGPSLTPLFDYNADDEVNSSDLVNGVAPAGEKFNEGIPAESTMLGNVQYTPSSQTDEGDEIDQRKLSALSSAHTGRLSWRELISP